MLVTRYIGNSGSIARTCCRTLSVSASGDPWPRTTTVRARVGNCRCGRYIAARESASSASCFTAPTTPTTVIHGAVELASNPPRRTRRPIGSSSGPQLRGHALVDHDHARRAADVQLAEQAPAPQRDLHRAEVVGADNPLVDVDERLAGLRHPALDGDRPPRHHLAQRQRRHPAHARRRPAAPPRAPRSPDRCRAPPCRRRISAPSSSTRA